MLDDLHLEGIGAADDAVERAVQVAGVLAVVCERFEEAAREVELRHAYAARLDAVQIATDLPHVFLVVIVHVVKGHLAN